MLNSQSNYAAEITLDEHHLIRACFVMAVRLAEEKMGEAGAVAVTNKCTDTLIALNEGRITTEHVDIINGALEGMCRLLRNDNKLSGAQKRQATVQAHILMNKLTRGTLG